MYLSQNKGADAAQESGTVVELTNAAAQTEAAIITALTESGKLTPAQVREVVEASTDLTAAIVTAMKGGFSDADQKALDAFCASAGQAQYVAFNETGGDCKNSEAELLHLREAAQKLPFPAAKMLYNAVCVTMAQYCPELWSYIIPI